MVKKGDGGSKITEKRYESTGNSFVRGGVLSEKKNTHV